MKSWGGRTALSACLLQGDWFRQYAYPRNRAPYQPSVIPIVELLLEHQPSLLHEIDDFGLSAFHLMMRFPYYELISKFINEMKPEDAMRKCNEGKTPLHYRLLLQNVEYTREEVMLFRRVMAMGNWEPEIERLESP